MSSTAARHWGVTKMLWHLCVQSILAFYHPYGQFDLSQTGIKEVDSLPFSSSTFEPKNLLSSSDAGLFHCRDIFVLR